MPPRRPKTRSSRRSSRRFGSGEGVEDKSLESAKSFILLLRTLAQDALHELETKRGPGKVMSRFVGYMKGYRNEDWYEHYYR
jgi:hypothetical protein